MNLNEYQDWAESTVIFDSAFDIIYPALKLAGEAGEVAEKVGKFIRDEGHTDLDGKTEEAIALELGDVLWYVAVLANRIEYSLEEIAQINIDKLSDRKVRNVLKGSGDNR
jgi:NTP pyrophosphatase (non-canonical NTP hydrolase)